MLLLKCFCIIQTFRVCNNISIEVVGKLLFPCPLSFLGTVLLIQLDPD